MKPLALIVDDDPSIREALGDRLDSLGHHFHTADSQKEARERLDDNAYAYILLDLELPVRLGRPPSITVGKNLLREICQNPRHTATPVIIVTAHGRNGPDLAVDLMKNGAIDFVNKPFENLDQSIQEALARPRPAAPLYPSAAPEHPAPAPVLREVQSGTLELHPQSICFEGNEICRPENGIIWQIFRILRERRPNGRPRAFPGKALAEALGLERGQNAVSEAVCAFRERSNQILREAGIQAENNTILISGGPGYRLNPDLQIEDHMDDPNAPTPPPSKPTPGERQTWFLQQVTAGKRPTRRHHERKFDISTATAKRDLEALSNRIQFVGNSTCGHYSPR